MKLGSRATVVGSLSHATGVYPGCASLSLRKSGKPRLATGEGWGEGLRSLVKFYPLTRIAIAIRPLAMGEVSLQPHRFNQISSRFTAAW